MSKVSFRNHLFTVLTPNNRGPQKSLVSQEFTTKLDKVERLEEF